MGVDRCTDQRAARGRLAGRGRDRGHLRALEHHVEHARFTGVEAAQPRRDADGLEPHALAPPFGRLRSQPRPAEVPPATAPRAGRYSQPTQPSQPLWADTASITPNR